ncbi:hypothetical protein [Solicola gregarius]|uniref:Uncharacterized protein n=1 Tax=Solicola gregarius TaxID=2908642 RepID=A0AA46YJT8_9ACTN|nr:hypothetical protein [Solicola gregarius]UYM04935.1 hypothetical protein L0C25_20805 [Solicola gregarius]
MEGTNNFVHLNDPGNLTKIGTSGYGDGAEGEGGSTKNFLTRAEEGGNQLVGRAGNTAQTISATTALSSAHLAKHLADQAVRAVLTEKEGLTGDEEAEQGQQGATSAAESFVTAVNKPINI